MSINLGNEGINAARELKGAPNWEVLRRAIYDLVSRLWHDSMASDITHRVESTAYVRGITDLYVALESATEGVNQRQVERPKPRLTNAG
jgi:hypothetical protein